MAGPEGAIGLPGRKPACLLAYLACTAPRAQPREKLAALLWGSHAEPQARQNLRQALMQLRRLLGPDAFVMGEAEVALAPGALECDAVRLPSLVRDGGRDALAEALALYHGPLLADVELAEEGWTAWLGAERARIETLALDAAMNLGEAELAAGQGEGALGVARRALAINPLREDACRLAMRALAAVGRNAEAQKLLQDLARLLRQELGAAPDPQTVALAESLRRAPPTGAPPAAEASGKPTVAVLPFRGIGVARQAGDELGEGITDEVIATLGRFRDLSVVARGSSAALEGLQLTNSEAAGRLGARYLLGGTVRSSGGRVRVSAELIHAAGDARIWSERFDRTLADPLDLEEEIGVTIAAAVMPAIRDAEIQRARRRRPANPSAHDLQLGALPHLWSGTRDGVERAIGMLRQSVALDPASGPALAALAWGLAMAGPPGAPQPPGSQEEALDLARRAVALDPEDAFAHAVCGFILSGTAESIAEGKAHAEEATQLNPGSAFAWGVLGVIGSRDGDFGQAIACLERALRLSPLDAMRHLWKTALAAAAFALGRYEQGILWARKCLRENPGNGMACRVLAANLAAAGLVEEARRVSRMGDAVQRTTLREMREAGYFTQAQAMQRYLEAQRMAGVPE